MLPSRIGLSDEEEALWRVVRPLAGGFGQGNPSTGNPVDSDAMETLMVSLLRQDKIPEVRLRVFEDPKLREKGDRSPAHEFRHVSGSEVYRQARFAPHLRYFIEGPDLPEDVIERLAPVLHRDAGVSGDVLARWRDCARNHLRETSRPKAALATEMFRLAIEAGIEADDARMIRNAIMKAL